MLKLSDAAKYGRGKLTVRRVLLAGAAALGLYSFGDDGISYLSTATRLVSDEVSDSIPVEFELERARTMIDGLVPDIRRNMVVIAKEEVSVENIRAEIGEARETLGKQRAEMLVLRSQLDNENQEVHLGTRPATREEIEGELKRRFSRYKMGEATLGAKGDLLASREGSLAAARQKLEKMLNAKRDLEVQVENLQARLRTVESESATARVDFDESQVVRCQKLVDELQVRLQVAEKMIAANGEIEDVASTFTIGDQDVLAEIDEYFDESTNRVEIAGKTW